MSLKEHEHGHTVTTIRAEFFRTINEQPKKK